MRGVAFGRSAHALARRRGLIARRPWPPPTPDPRRPRHLGTIVTRFPGLASAVHAQVTRLLATVLPTGDGAIATEAQLDELLGAVVARVVAGSGKLRADPPPELDELVDAMVLLLARHSVARARPGLVERVLGAKWN